MESTVPLDGSSSRGSGNLDLSSELAITVVRFARHLRLRRNPKALSLSQLSAMTTLRLMGPLTPGALASLERVTPPSMSRVVKKLTAAGMVTRQPHAEDRRLAVVSLTPVGADVIADVNEARHQWLTTRLAQLSGPDRDVLREAVEAIEALLPDNT